MSLLKMIFSLLKNRADKNQYYLEIGVYFLKKGVGRKVGDAFTLPGKKKRTVWIDNLYCNFKENRINHRFTNKPPQHAKNG